jgi:uncharacterized membrane protein
MQQLRQATLLQQLQATLSAAADRLDTAIRRDSSSSSSNRSSSSSSSSSSGGGGGGSSGNQGNLLRLCSALLKYATTLVQHG